VRRGDGVSVKMSKNKEILENILQEAARNGETVRLIELLEMGAPFVVDTVRSAYLTCIQTDSERFPPIWIV
jgi:hypothetical protein